MERRTIKRAAVNLFAAAALIFFLGLTRIAAGQAGGDQATAAVSGVSLVDAFPGLRFNQASLVTHAGDDRLFVGELPGTIWDIKGRGTGASRTLFLDIADRVQDGCEMGLLGLAFHPRYAENGYFYVNYIVNREGEYYTRISRFQATADADRAAAESERVLMEIKQPYCNHNGGDLHFDPQGMLVTSLGDGGSGGDPHANGQNPQSYLGKLLRIDVDKAQAGKDYAIPADNPFSGQAALPEIWMLGLRNAWRFSFDRLTGDLYIGDVGQNRWEEVNYVPAAEAGGQNFEWSLKEGLGPFKPDQPAGPGVMREPVHVYAHENDDRCYSITGGYVYRGRRQSSLYGHYVYADYCGGEIYTLNRGGAGWQSRLLLNSGQRIVSFGEDSGGELYVVAGDGRIYRLEAPLRDEQILLPLILKKPPK